MNECIHALVVLYTDIHTTNELHTVIHVLDAGIHVSDILRTGIHTLDALNTINKATFPHIYAVNILYKNYNKTNKLFMYQLGVQKF